MIFNCVLGGICLLIASLPPAPGGAQESPASNQAGFSPCCSQFDRVTVRIQNLSFAQSKAQRRQPGLAAITSGGWSGLVRLKRGFARATSSEATYSSAQTSQPSDRAPPPFTA
ncbi:MAG TPA: hypothetical protein VNI02_23635 [Blastocatellia bacterium]|nr:hypothetical protein [Blastocatellia bacterium]